jgi:hypothetical protein
MDLQSARQDTSCRLRHRYRVSSSEQCAILASDPSSRVRLLVTSFRSLVPGRDGQHQGMAPTPLSASIIENHLHVPGMSSRPECAQEAQFPSPGGIPAEAMPDRFCPKAKEGPDFLAASDWRISIGQGSLSFVPDVHPELIKFSATVECLFLRSLSQLSSPSATRHYTKASRPNTYYNHISIPATPNHNFLLHLSKWVSRRVRFFSESRGRHQANPSPPRSPTAH